MKASAYQTETRNQQQQHKEFTKQSLDNLISGYQDQLTLVRFKNLVWEHISKSGKDSASLSIDRVKELNSLCTQLINKSDFVEICTYILDLLDTENVSEFAKGQFLQYLLGLIDWDEVGVENPYTSPYETKHKKIGKKLKLKLFQTLESGTPDKNLAKFNIDQSIKDHIPEAKPEDISSFKAFYVLKANMELLKDQIDEFNSKFGNNLNYRSLRNEILATCAHHLDYRDYAIWQARQKITKLCQKYLLKQSNEYEEICNGLLDITNCAQRLGINFYEMEHGNIIRYLLDLDTWENIESRLRFLKKIKEESLENKDD